MVARPAENRCLPRLALPALRCLTGWGQDRWLRADVSEGCGRRTLDSRILEGAGCSMGRATKKVESGWLLRRTGDSGGRNGISGTGARVAPHRAVCWVACLSGCAETTSQFSCPSPNPPREGRAAWSRLSFRASSRQASTRWWRLEATTTRLLPLTKH